MNYYFTLRDRMMIDCVYLSVRLTVYFSVCLSLFLFFSVCICLFLSLPFPHLPINKKRTIVCIQLHEKCSFFLSFLH